MAKKALSTSETSAAAAPAKKPAAPRARKHVKAQAVVAAVEEFVTAIVHPVKAAVAETPHAPRHEDVSRLAYRFYLERGGQGGSPAEDWIRAEQTLRG